MSSDDEINIDIPDELADLLDRVSDKPKQVPQPKEIVEPKIEKPNSKKLKHDETTRSEVLDTEIIDVSGNIESDREIVADVRRVGDNPVDAFEAANEEVQLDELDEKLTEKIFTTFTDIINDCNLDREEAQHAINGLRQEFEDNVARRDIVVEGYISAIQTKATALNTKVRAAELLVKLKNSRKSNISIKDSNVLIPEQALHDILNKKKKK